MLKSVNICFSSNFDKIYVVERSWYELFRSIIFIFIGEYLMVLLASETMPCTIISILHITTPATTWTTRFVMIGSNCIQWFFTAHASPHQGLSITYLAVGTNRWGVEISTPTHINMHCILCSAVSNSIFFIFLGSMFGVTYIDNQPHTVWIKYSTYFPSSRTIDNISCGWYKSLGHPDINTDTYQHALHSL